MAAIEISNEVSFTHLRPLLNHDSYFDSRWFLTYILNSPYFRFINIFLGLWCPATIGGCPEVRKSIYLFAKGVDQNCLIDCEVKVML